MLVKGGSVLSRTHGDLVVSKYKRRQAEGVALVRSKRDAGQQTVGFTSRPFVLCGLPLRRPPTGQLKHERRNGRFTLQVVGHPDFGLPFGQDRLVPIFLATLALRQKSPIVRFSGGQEVLDMFGLARGGKEYRRMVTAFERVFGSTIFFSDESGGGTVRVMHRARFHFMSEARIWYEGSGENEIVLSDEFYREVAAHPIPVDLEAVKVLAATPGALDLFTWLTYRCFCAKQPEMIPLSGPTGLAGQLGAVEYSRPRRFRAMIEEWLDRIRLLWPSCPCHVEGDRLQIRPSAIQAVCR
jgi:hypothetical protein